MPQVYIPDMMKSQHINEGEVKLCVAIRGRVEENVDILVETKGNGSALGIICWYIQCHNMSICIIVKVS